MGTFGSGIWRARILATASAGALCAALAAGGAAWAQDDEVDEIPAAEETTPAADGSQERIVVTGSRIQRLDYSANSPIVTVQEGMFEDTATIGLSTILNRLPQFVPALDQFTAGDIQPTAQNTVGSSTVSLRGLGANRTLTLIDGRRGAPVNASLAVDTDSIASAAIQRTEIISGGASAVYGADAIAGVVNFILKDNYEGFEIETRYGISELGDSSEFDISTLFGANFDGGRGNVMMSLEHASRGAAWKYDRDWAREEAANPYVTPDDFWFSNTYLGRITGSTANFNAAVVDRIFSEVTPCDTDGVGGLNPPRAANASGTITAITCPTTSVPRTASFFLNDAPDITSGSVWTGGYLFGGRTGTAGSYRYDGPFMSDEVEGLTFRKLQPDGSIGQINPIQYVSRPLERYTAFARGRYEINDWVSAFALSTFSRTKTDTLSQYTAALGSNAVVIPYGNTIYGPSIGVPLGQPLPADAATRATRPEYLPGGALGLNNLAADPISGAPAVTCGPVGGCTETYVFPVPAEVRALLNSRTANVAAGTLGATRADEDYTLNRALDFVGRRTQLNDSLTFQSLIGFEGELPNEWFWDLSVSYAETETSSDLYGDVSRERYRAVASAPNFGYNSQFVGNAAFGGQRAGQARCSTGLPLVTQFEVSQDCLDAITSVTHNDQTITTTNLAANLTGDLFDLPAGPLSFAVGAEYRDYDYVYNVDNLQLFTSFVENGSGIRPVNPSAGYYSLQEIYGELLVPIVGGLPFIQELNLELGGRLSDYSTVGNVETYKGLVDWTIVDWLRLRGGYNRATRAPNIAELYQGRTSIFTGSSALYGDQCSQNNPNAPYGTNATGNVNGATGAAFALDMCRAIMGEDASTFYYDNRTVAEQPAFTAAGGGTPNTIGNPNVGPETADTYTLGFVVRSPIDTPWLAGFSGSIDYFDIQLNDMIAAESSDDVYERCLNPAINTANDPNTPSCQAIIRDLITGAALNVDTTVTNEGRSTTKGIDVQVDWRSDFADLGLTAVPGGLSVNVTSSFNLENTTQASDTSTVFDWKGTRGCALGLSCMQYDYRVFTNVGYNVGPASVGVRWNHYPSVDSSQSVTNPASTVRGILKSYDVFALTGSYQLNDNFTFRAGVENVLDEEPTLAGGDPNATPFPTAPTRLGNSIYDPIGRRYYVGLTTRF